MADSKMLSSILSIKFAPRPIPRLRPNEQLAKLLGTGPFVAGRLRRFSTSVKREEKREHQALPARNLPVYQGKIFHRMSLTAPCQKAYIL